ncbi:putative reverse transcriptase domain-containing protein, partial [Tanacetum coccineum]
HMTGNKSFLIDYQEINGGFVAFGGSPKGGKITGKGKIRTGKLDFEDVYFVKKLKFNLFYVSQMCDKKNNVLFTETECLVLSPNFKLLDERDLTFLFAKATIDKSNLWHRSLGHINFKTINKLVRGNLVRDTVMSDSEDSTVTYTAVSSPFGGLSDIGSPGVDGPPVMPEDPYAYVVAAFQAPPSPDYVSGPEYPPSPDFVPEPVYPEFMPPEDEVLLAEEQPLPAALSPSTNLPGYVPELDPEEDLKEDDDEDPKEDPADYPADGGDDGDDEDESSDDDEDDDVDIEGDEEEEEHPAPADSTVVALPAVDQAPSAEETEPFETDESAATPPPHPAYHIPSLPLTLILSPLPVSPPLLVSSPLPTSPIHLLGYRAAMIWLRVEAPSTSHSLLLPPPIILFHTISDAPSSGILPISPIPLPTSSPPLHLLSTDRGESSSAPTARPPGGFRVDYGFVATMDREIMRDLERDVGYGITDTWDEMLVDMPGAPATNDTELGRGWMSLHGFRAKTQTSFITRLDDEQTERQLMAGQLNMLYRDRRAHARTARLMEAEARMSREAWG